MNLEMAVILRIIVACIGCFLLVVDFLSYCKQKLKENYAFLWGVIAVALILVSVIPVLSGWSKAVSGWLGVALIIVMFFLIWILFTMSLDISQMVLKNQELAMQVSLLNNENVTVLKTLNSITGEDIMRKNDEK